MLKKVKSFIQEMNLFSNDEPIICAVSGGVDSVCLLHMLHQLNYNVVLAHVNHHKRAESALEEAAMQKLADAYHIPFELLEYYDDGKDNFQNKAHFARYTFFKELAKKYKTKWIATAHHLNDQAETIIMRLLSGSNLYGYAGISVIKNEEDYSLVRPLLCLSKEELYDYAKQNKLTYFEDASNQSDDYLRNRIRHHILPLLEKENPNYLKKLQEFSIQTKQTFDFIRKQSINYLDKLNNNIDIASFEKLDVALRNDIICLLFERYELDKNKDTIEKCSQLILKKMNCKYQLKNNYFFNIAYGKAFIQIKQKEVLFSETIGIDETINILNQYKFYFSKKIPQNNEKYLKLCYNDLKLPFLIRNRKEGDIIKMNYGNKKVSRIFIDEKLPTWKRNQIPLIFDSEENLLWIYNFAKSKAVLDQKQDGDIYFVCEEIKSEE